MNLLTVPVFNWRVPGEQDGLSYSDKQIIVNADHHIRDRLAITIAPNLGTDLDVGTILGVSTADSLFRPVRRYLIQAAAASGVQVVTVPGGAVINVGDTVSVMKADGTGIESGGAVTSIVVNGNNLDIHFTTVTAEALAVSDFLYVSDGSQKALVVLADVVLDATQNKIASAYVAGKFFQSKLVGLDSFAINDLKARSIPYGNDPVTNQPDSIVIV
jgi:hypothetical protein